MQLSGGKRGLRRLLLLILISMLILYPRWTPPPSAQIIQPVSALHTNAVSPSSFSLNEWNVPTPGAGPWGVTTDQLGKTWFTESITNKLARFDPINNNFTEWSIPGGGSPRYVFTRQLIAGGSNVTRVYFTEYSSNKIAYFNSWNGTFSEWQLPVGSNPVGIFVESNSTGPTDGNYRIWFTESGRDVIGLLSPATNQLTEWTLPGATSTPGVPLLQPWGIYVQPLISGQYHNETDRYVYFTELSNNAIGRLQVRSPQNLLILWDMNTPLSIPGLKYGPMDITVDSTSPGPGNVIFSGSAGDRISVLQLCGSACSGYTEYALPARNYNSKPTSVAIDPSRGLYWFTEYNTGIIATVDSSSIGNPTVIPTPTQCVIPPTIAPACGSPSGYTTTTAGRTITNNVLGVSNVGNSQPNTLNVFQGPINGINEYKLPNITARPNFVSVDSVGNVWFTESNVTVNRIGRVSTPYAFQLSVSPNSQSIQIGQSTTYNVIVSLKSGIPYSVQLSVNNPQGVTASFSPPIGILQPSNPFSSILTLVTSNSTSPGTYTMNVMASSGGQTQTFPIILTISPLPPPPSFDFVIDVTNAGGGALMIQQGQQATFQLQVSPSTSAPTQEVDLTVNQNGLPLGITIAQFVNVIGNPPFSSVLIIQTSLTTPAQSYDLTNLITGVTKGGAPHYPRQKVILIVTEVPRDFNVTISSNTVNVVQASRVDLTVTVTSVGPFVGDVSLTGSFSPADPGLTVTFSPSTLSPLPNGGIVESTMEVIARRNTPGQTYQLTVIASSRTPSRTHQLTLSVHVSPCLIATAAFGSELAPEVQFLRDFRDQQILHTFAGSTFMSVFNSWYYSFSPNIAQYESRNTVMRGVIRIMLYPLLTILHMSSEIYSILGFQPELGVLTAGILASLLIGMTYLSFPLIGLFLVCRKRLTLKLKRRAANWMAFLMISLITSYGISEMLSLPLLMMFISSGIVMTFLTSGAILSLSITVKLAERSRSVMRLCRVFRFL